MDISLKPGTCHRGFVITYSIYKDSRLMGFLCFCETLCEWQIVGVKDRGGFSLLDISETWSLLINRLGLEKA